MRIATFNVQNLRLRPYPDGEGHLDGARDGDLPGDLGQEAHRLDQADRRLTAAVLHAIDADVVALQEVHDRATLDHFHDTFLTATGLAPYPYRICLPGNDAMGRNLAVLSRRAPDAVESHAGLTARDLGLERPAGLRAERPVFSRDCLVCTFGRLTLLVCHFKAPWPDAASTFLVRRFEATAVRRLIERRFADPAAALWLVLGDLNEPSSRVPPPEQAIAPLVDGFAVDLLERQPQGRRWTYREPSHGGYSRPDALLASPALAAGWPDARPRLVREGMGREAALYPGPRLHGVGEHRPHASDHAALMVEFAGL